MNISIFGLGYVGCVSAACLAKEGHSVIGVDVNPLKVDILNDGKSPIVENQLDKILEELKNGDYKPGSLLATTDSLRSVLDSELSMICVGTPSRTNGNLKLDYVRRCSRDIGEGLKKKTDYHVVVARSTMLPGSVDDAVIKEIEYISGKRAGRDFGVVMNPEFLRESTSVRDFYNPPVTVIGQLDDKSGKAVEAVYSFLNAPVVKTDICSAEMIKYACNTFHALKITFANEIGRLCKALGINSHSVMEIFCMDNKLNLSPYYLKPGFAFGGSCLPKDLRAINYKAKIEDVEVPLLNTIITSNRIHIERTINRIQQLGKKKIGLLGLSFKAGTDDMRESPLVSMAESLIGKGYDILIYDYNVSLAGIFGANKEYIEKEIPHISSLLCEKLEDIVAHAEVIIIGNQSSEFKKVLEIASPETIIVDLVQIKSNEDISHPGYDGVCW